MGGIRITGSASHRVLGVAIGLALLALPLAACGGGSGNAGGNTSCGTYEGLSSAGRSAAVKAMIDQQGGDDSAAEVDLAELSVDAYCALSPASDPISDVYK